MNKHHGEHGARGDCDNRFFVFFRARRDSRLPTPDSRWIKAALCGVVAILLLRVAPAEIKIAHKYERPGPQATPIPFNSSDFIQLAADVPKPKIFMGEPLVVNLRLINHTRFAFGIVTNFNPRGKLSVSVQPEHSRERRSYGPYRPGGYVPRDYLLYPLEEHEVTYILWADIDTGNGLVFPKPGKYRLSFKLHVGMYPSEVKGDIRPVNGDFQVVPFFDVEVLPTPEAWKPLVDALIEIDAFEDLHVKVVPPGQYERIVELIGMYPTTPLTPYLDHAVAMKAWEDAGKALTDIDKLNQAIRHLQRVTLSESSRRWDAHLELIRVYDKKEMTWRALETCDRLLKAAPLRQAALFGSIEYVRKYMMNSVEMDPIEYWSLLDE